MCTRDYWKMMDWEGRCNNPRCQLLRSVCGLESPPRLRGITPESFKYAARYRSATRMRALKLRRVLQDAAKFEAEVEVEQVDQVATAQDPHYQVVGARVTEKEVIEGVMAVVGVAATGVNYARGNVTQGFIHYPTEALVPPTMPATASEVEVAANVFTNEVTVSVVDTFEPNELERMILEWDAELDKGGSR